jgi:uracil-DNA glycosylase
MTENLADKATQSIRLSSALDGTGGPVTGALERFLQRTQSDWTKLDFFRSGAAAQLAARLDQEIAESLRIVPPPEAIFTAFTLTPFESVRVVILGQDPYPRPGDAHGLAFSFQGQGAIPASLRVILKEVAHDCAVPPESLKGGDLTGWAEQGVLLLNTALTTQEGKAGNHLTHGWDALTDEILTALDERERPVMFLLWGRHARSKAALISRKHHGILEAGHPSPLNRLRDFSHSRPFSQTNAFLLRNGEKPIDWRLVRKDVTRPEEPPHAVLEERKTG